MATSRIAKVGASLGAAAWVLCAAAGAGAAPHPGGNHTAARAVGTPHFAAPHFAAPHFAAPHFAAPHFAAPHIAAPRFARSPRIAAPRITRQPRLFDRGPRMGRFAHRTVPHLWTLHASYLGVAGSRNAAIAGTHRITDPRRFASDRHFAGDPAFRPFLGRRWHFHHHYGWIGPLFWPYAYGDFFYYALWPYAYAYYDPFWYYGYDDIYEAMFWPYDETEYVQGPGAPARAQALTQTVAQSCFDEAAEVTGWPIDQIQAALQPNPQQTALLDALGNAIVKASDVIRAHCPTQLAFIPTDRLAQMQQRLVGLVQAVNIVQVPLAKFYDSLSDEQKARFNDIGLSGGKSPAHGQAAVENPRGQCGGNPASFPIERIDRTIAPNQAQRAKLDALQAASARAADLVAAACPSELPATPPDRLAAEGKRLQAMLAAVQTIRPALDDFYNSLSDEQKARFNRLGRQILAQR